MVLLYAHFSKLSFVLLSIPTIPTPPLCVQAQSLTTPLVGPQISCHAPSSAPGVFLCNPVWSRMSRQLSQLPTPDLPAGASPQFGSCTQPAGSLTGGHLNTMTGLKSLLQHPMKGDQRLKLPSDLKGEKCSYFGIESVLCSLHCWFYCNLNI